MKAIVIREFGGPEVLSYEDIETPEPGPGEVLCVRKLGSQLTVRMPGEAERPEEVTDLDGLIVETIRTARRQGYSLQQLHDRIGECLIHQSPDHVLVTSSDSGMRVLIQEELREHLACEIESCSNEDLLAEPNLAIGALVVGPPGR